MHFRREDEGGAAHVVSNGTSLVNQNGFGRGRHAVPGAEAAKPAGIPGAEPANAGDENLSKAALKNKKKREAKKAKEAEMRAQGLTVPGDAPQGQRRGSDARRGSNANRDRERSGSGSDGPPGQRQRRPSRNDRHPHSHSPNGGANGGHHGPQAHRPKQNHQGGNQQGGGAPLTPLAVPSTPAVQRVAEVELSVTSPGAGSPANKKLRGLQKKIRAIEDLEMRLAGGEKLEDTQMKKIGTKKDVLKELESLEAENN
jgi:translation initiation factor 2A